MKRHLAVLTGPHALTEHEVKVLRLLKEGPLHRSVMVSRLAPNTSAPRTNQVCALIAGAWCRRLVRAKLVWVETHKPRAYYAAHRITEQGIRWLETYEYFARNQRLPEYVEGP